MADSEARRTIREVARTFDPSSVIERRDGKSPSANPENFQKMINRRGRGCWRWKGPVDQRGRAYLRVNGNRVAAHRWMWRQVMKRKLPEQQRLYRTCGNRTCCRPDHLSTVKRIGAR